MGKNESRSAEDEEESRFALEEDKSCQKGGPTGKFDNAGPVPGLSP